MNPTAAIFINLALLFYTIGVWSRTHPGTAQDLAHDFLLARACV